MPDKKHTAPEVLTGSTGNPLADAPTRVLLITFASGLTGALCYAFGADAALTASLGTTASAGAALAAVLFDAIGPFRKR